MNNIASCWTINFSSALLIGLVTLLLWVKGVERPQRWYWGAFLLLLMLVVCLDSPLAVLSSDYLFSAHMLVHVILLLIAGPLMALLVLPSHHSMCRFAGRHPIAGWIVGVGIMWIWHLPFFFNWFMHMSMAGSPHGITDLLPLMENLSLLVAGAFFSVPVVNPDPYYRLQPLAGVLYLFTACIGCSLLGLLITFAPSGTYHHFLSMDDPYGLNGIISERWRINAQVDQQAAGLIMWVPCCLVYVLYSMYLIIKWLSQKEEIVPLTQ